MDCWPSVLVAMAVGQRLAFQYCVWVLVGLPVAMDSQVYISVYS